MHHTANKIDCHPVCACTMMPGLTAAGGAAAGVAGDRKVGGAPTHPSALARATPRPTDGDGDWPRGHGRTPVECRAHCASSKGRQGHVARVEPVGRGGTTGGGVALRPPFTPTVVTFLLRGTLPMTAVALESYLFAGSVRKKMEPMRSCSSSWVQSLVSAKLIPRTQMVGIFGRD